MKCVDFREPGQVGFPKNPTILGSFTYNEIDSSASIVASSYGNENVIYRGDVMICLAFKIVKREDFCTIHNGVWRNFDHAYVYLLSKRSMGWVCLNLVRPM